jgi:asparagine synthase (glutamine-hydrolysing)
MAASVEVRVPFVDRIVAEAAFTIPGTEKIRGKVQKAALKDAAETWLPHEITHRPKASFGAPLRAWVRNDLTELINDTLVRGELVQAGMIRREPLLRLIADEKAGREDYAKQIWQLLSMELWYRQVRDAGVAA